ncbi:venom protein 164-like [Homarus americanus]|uniref:Venom protein 164-like n=1 Tax=Homarus americanus TaxID=6706 RepID=A0A8J5MMP2_HOMAM|nr:venom protein 164-like [Homarus americanus]KAG7157024.1 Venom protein 164-like [Homarus americanus]
MNCHRGRLLVLVVLMVVVAVSPLHAVPKRVANRMIPSWWSTVKNVCWSVSDCEPSECCTRPMLSSKAYCMPLRSRGQACDASPLMLNFAKQVYFSDCPCQYDLTCASLSNKHKSQCVDLRTLEVDYRRLAAMNLPLPSENH